jgi:hypothetical protein
LVAALKEVPRGAMGLTEPETRVLTDVAKEWASKGRAYSDAEKLLRREALYQSIEADEYPAKVVEKRAKELAQRVTNLQAERARALQEQLQKLRASLGDERFQSVEAFIRARAPNSSFFPDLVAPVSIDVRRTTKK